MNVSKNPWVNGVVVALIANAVALALAAVIFDRFAVSTVGFPVVVLVFTVVSLLIQPVVKAVLSKHVGSLTVLMALVTSYVTLLIVDLVMDGLSIEGAGTWVMSTVLVWAAALATAAVLGRGRGTPHPPQGEV